MPSLRRSTRYRRVCKRGCIKEQHPLHPHWKKHFPCHSQKEPSFRTRPPTFNDVQGEGTPSLSNSRAAARRGVPLPRDQRETCPKRRFQRQRTYVYI